MALSAGSALGLLMAVHKLSSPEDFQKNADGMQKSASAKVNGIELLASEEGPRKTHPLPGAGWHPCVQSKDLWHEQLAPAAHRCSDCRKVFHESPWASHLTRRHGSIGLDLVWARRTTFLVSYDSSDFRGDRLDMPSHAHVTAAVQARSRVQWVCTPHVQRCNEIGVCADR